MNGHIKAFIDASIMPESSNRNSDSSISSTSILEKKEMFVREKHKKLKFF